MRNHRAKLRDAIVDMTLRSPKLLDPLSPTLSIADHARHLIEHYRFLDASYEGDRTPKVMYGSPLFAKVLYHMYTSRTWRAVLRVSLEVDFQDPAAKGFEEDWMPCPPTSVLAFAGTLTINALECCAVGFRQSRAPMDEESHRQVYSLLFAHLERELKMPHAQAQLEQALNMHRLRM
ncbi:hypothetical protein BJ322DRAFT_1091791, partial [Thelephora terrestris]